MARMRYRLRTLLILLAVMPPLLAVAWWALDTFRPKPDAGWSPTMPDGVIVSPDSPRIKIYTEDY